jgi:A/G-specific adenine glycosylase
MFGTAEVLAQAVPNGLHCQHEASFVHVLTHKDLHLHPVRVAWPSDQIPEADANGAWMCRAQWEKLGLPAPVRKLLEAV